MRKGDVRTQRFNIECKRTDAQQITLKASTLEKNWAEAWAEGRLPLTGFELHGRRYVVLNEDDYLEDHGGIAATATVDEGGEVPGSQPGPVLPRKGRNEL